MFSLRRFLDLEGFYTEQYGREKDGNVVGVNGDHHRSGLLEEPSSSVLVKVPGRAIRDLFRVID